MYRTASRLLVLRPLLTPTVMLIVGIALLIVGVVDSMDGFAGPGIALGLGLGGLLTLVGLVALPVGLIRWTYRRRNAMEVRCPRCLTLSTDALQPFDVVRRADLDYVAINCSNCNNGFTMPATAKLIGV